MRRAQAGIVWINFGVRETTRRVLVLAGRRGQRHWVCRCSIARKLVEREGLALHLLALPHGRGVCGSLCSVQNAHQRVVSVCAEDGARTTRARLLAESAFPRGSRPRRSGCMRDARDCRELINNIRVNNYNYPHPSGARARCAVCASTRIAPDAPALRAPRRHRLAAGRLQHSC